MGHTGGMTTPMAQDLAALQEHELRDLAQRYDVPGPRYTSYPALPDWSGSFGAAEWEQHLQQLAAPDASVALYVHLPFCVARCLYCGCNATVTTRDEVVDRYLARLARDQFRGLRALSFTRISFGVQDLDADVQRAIGRVQPESLVRDVVAMARDEGFTGINVDLIYGLSRQTRDSFARTVDSAIEVGADRLAVLATRTFPGCARINAASTSGRYPAAPSACCCFMTPCSVLCRPDTCGWASTTSRVRTIRWPWQSARVRCTATSWATPRGTANTCSVLA
jgi:hypothetical protein